VGARARPGRIGSVGSVPLEDKDTNVPAQNPPLSDDVETDGTQQDEKTEKTGNVDIDDEHDEVSPALIADQRSDNVAVVLRLFERRCPRQLLVLWVSRCLRCLYSVSTPGHTTTLEVHVSGLSSGTEGGGPLLCESVGVL
jgi:hypothetical protein